MLNQFEVLGITVRESAACSRHTPCAVASDTQRSCALRGCAAGVSPRPTGRSISTVQERVCKSQEETTEGQLGGTLAQGFGLTVNANGLGSYSLVIGFAGEAFNVPNHTILNVYQIMMAAGQFAVNGKPYANQTQLAVEAYSIFKLLNNEF